MAGKWLDPRLRDKIVQRDNHKCQKCSYEENQVTLNVHHIIARQDGGKDDENNLITLCKICHDEWHMCEMHLNISFEDWLLRPPYRILTTIFSDRISKDEETMRVSLHDIRSALGLAHMKMLGDTAKEYIFNKKLHIIDKPMKKK